MLLISMQAQRRGQPTKERFAKLLVTGVVNCCSGPLPHKLKPTRQPRKKLWYAAIARRLSAFEGNTSLNVFKGDCPEYYLGTDIENLRLN